ncbi:branched-chain amino acid ABC transporter permease [Rhodococcus qingshengii]|uniref:branched-chain amino acid ABC transporter permease n=1 Tax=Rhodococcus qingshengii TaxID=334542 RepID=UPI00237CA68F|nr:branched-chain amino acid ABC transporter permease [Rhodococcus qingshengii]WCT05750.1 branched-chain amino acid ABC transporter permease [Rhodococcus qingshengii]
MQRLLELLLLGISLGSIYAVIALGFVVVFKATRIVNLAHGSILLFGAYVLSQLHGPLGFWLGLLAALTATVAVALLVELLVMRPARGLDDGALATLTIGVDILMLTELTRRIGGSIPDNGAPWASRVVTIAGLDLPLARVIATAVVLVLLAALAFAFRYTDWGISMRAAAADGPTASLMGISLNRIGLYAWGMAGLAAGFGGLFLSSYPSAGVTATLGITALAAIPAWVIGGFDSLPGAVVGGLIVGVIYSLATGYSEHLAFLGDDFGSVAPYVAMLLLLIVRPHGLLGRKDIVRV